MDGLDLAHSASPVLARRGGLGVVARAARSGPRSFQSAPVRCGEVAPRPRRGRGSGPTAARSASSGIDLQLARDVDRGEQHVADLVEARRRGRPSAASQLVELARAPRRRARGRSRSRSTPRGAGPCARTAARAGSRAPRRRSPARARPRSRLIASQLRSTSPACSTSTSPKMCGWRRISFWRHVLGDVGQRARRRAPRAAATGSGPGRARRRARRAAWRRRPRGRRRPARRPPRPCAGRSSARPARGPTGTRARRRRVSASRRATAAAESSGVAHPRVPTASGVRSAPGVAPGWTAPAVGVGVAFGAFLQSCVRVARRGSPSSPSSACGSP